MNDKFKDYYKLLGVTPRASFENIRSAAERELSQNWNNAIGRLEVQEAYEVLSNPEKRKEYDQEFNKRLSEREVAIRNARTFEEYIAATSLHSELSNVDVAPEVEVSREEIEQLENNNANNEDVSEISEPVEEDEQEKTTIDSIGSDYNESSSEVTEFTQENEDVSENEDIQENETKQEQELEEENQIVNQEDIQELEGDITEKGYRDLIVQIRKLATSRIILGHGGEIGKEYLKRKAALEYKMQSSTISTEELQKLAASEQIYLHRTGPQKYITGVINGTINDPTMTHLINRLQYLGKELGIEVPKTGEELYRQFSMINDQICKREFEEKEEKKQESKPKEQKNKELGKQLNITTNEKKEEKIETEDKPIISKAAARELIRYAIIAGGVAIGSLIIGWSIPGVVLGLMAGVATGDFFKKHANKIKLERKPVTERKTIENKQVETVVEKKSNSIENQKVNTEVGEKSKPIEIKEIVTDETRFYNEYAQNLEKQIVELLDKPNKVHELEIAIRKYEHMIELITQRMDFKTNESKENHTILSDMEILALKTKLNKFKEVLNQLNNKNQDVSKLGAEQIENESTKEDQISDLIAERSRLLEEQKQIEESSTKSL